MPSDTFLSVFVMVVILFSFLGIFLMELNYNLDATMIYLMSTDSREGIVAGVCCYNASCRALNSGDYGFWDPVKIGYLIVDPDLWGLENDKNDSVIVADGCSVIEKHGRTLFFNDNLTLYIEPTDDTLGYHEVIYGAKPWGSTVVSSPMLVLPTKCRDLPDLYINITYSLLAGTPGVDVAVDSWILSDTNTSRNPRRGDYEVMIMFYIEGGEPDGFENGSIGVFRIPIVVNGSFIVEEFSLYRTIRDGGWIFYTFKSKDNFYNVSLIFNYNYFLQILYNIDENFCKKHFLSSIELGVEVFTSNCNMYPCSVDVAWKLIDYNFIIVSK